jgi:anthranilate phosphoribosyltransferase
MLQKLVAREDLTSADAHALLDSAMTGQMEPTLLAAILAAWAAKGETVAELVGAAQAVRAQCTAVQLPPGVQAIDTCGTGGDGQPLFNVSTCTAIVAAAAGATVAKHGNRSNVRPSGSAEVLQALGVNVEADVPVLERCLAECRVAFLYAVRLHPAMKHAAPVRKALGIRTIFNLVGPLANPAGVRRQLVGVDRPARVPLMAEALRRLGAERAMVVHGREGLCDLSIGGSSLVAQWDGHALTTAELDVGVIGAAPGTLDALRVRSPQESATLIRAVLDGQPGPARDIVVFNAAAALWTAGRAADWATGASQARTVIDSGAARATLEQWIRVSCDSGH